VQSIGISAGASAPELLADEVIEALRDRRSIEIEEITVAVEDVVFKLPRDNSTDYIKRLVGLPGDRIQVQGGILLINDEPVPRQRIEDFDLVGRGGYSRKVQQYIETLPNGVSYRVLDSDPFGTLDNTDVYVVPDQHYFFMGDNRDHSSDSRVLNNVGYVPVENLLGRAEILFFSTDGAAHFWEVWKWPFAIRFSRFFTTL
ncbi:MAG: signal peptidase I, partial [Alphaproteobacteria bacterium]|nr:signal peptidase I [Alphaproteobacteria bacterium]